MSDTVLKQVTKTDIQQAKDEAERLYMNRVEGHGEDYQAQPDRHGNLPRKHFRGAVVNFQATGVDALLDLVIAKLAEGWKRSQVDTQNAGVYYFVHLTKPDAEIKADLQEEFKEAEASLRARVEAENEIIILDQVAKRKLALLKQREEAAKAADLALEEELLAEVRAALKGGK